MKSLLYASVILFSCPAWTTTKLPFCELEMQRPVRGVYTATRLGLEKHELKTADVKYMISDPKVIRDPYENIDRDIGNFDFRKVLQRYLHKLKPEHVDNARAALGQLIGQTVEREALVREARYQTRMILAPVERPLHNASTSNAEYTNNRWVTSKEGQLQVQTFDIETLSVKTFEIGRRDPVDKQYLKPLVDKYGVAWARATDHGHVLVLIHGEHENQILIHNIEENKSVVTEHIPHDLEHAHLARGMDGNFYVLARAPKAIFTYIVGPDLKVKEIRKDPFKSDFFRVITSPEGRVLVIAVLQLNMLNKGKLLIFDPTSDKPARKVSLQQSAINTSGAITPTGDYAIATYTVDDYNRKQIEFVTSDSTTPMRTEPFLDEPENGMWHVTPNGTALFLTKVSYRAARGDGIIGRAVRKYELQLYDPFHPTFAAPTGIFQRLRREQDTFLPFRKLNPHFAQGAPSFYESREGRLFVLIGDADFKEERRHISIYEPLEKKYAIHQIEIDGGQSLVSDAVKAVKMTYIKERDEYVFLVSRDNGAEIYAGWDAPSRIFSTSEVNFHSFAESHAGDTYALGLSPEKSQVFSSTLRLFRLTHISGEEQP